MQYLKVSPYYPEAPKKIIKIFKNNSILSARVYKAEDPKAINRVNKLLTLIYDQHEEGVTFTVDDCRSL